VLIMKLEKSDLEKQAWSYEVEAVGDDRYWED
jgi:hypothetical protein